VLGCPERVRVVLNSSSSRIWAQGPRAGEPLFVVSPRSLAYLGWEGGHVEGTVPPRTLDLKAGALLRL